MIGVPSGWEETSAFWFGQFKYLSYEESLAYIQGNIESAREDCYSFPPDQYDWRVEE